MDSQTAFKCLVCECSLLKGDVQFVAEDTFSFSSVSGKGLAGTYCMSCFDDRVTPELERYNLLMEKAKDVNVFFSSQSKESRFVRRTEKPIKVVDCQDRDEAVLRLAFLAAEAGKNSIVDVDLSSVKVMNGNWKSLRWSGLAVPANIRANSR
jgi:hypothetical protein